MTQPPDDRPPRPDEPEGGATPGNEPTVAWTPPEPDAEKPPEEGGPGWAAIPDGSEPPAAPAPPTEPPAAPPPPAPPSGPIISAAPTPPTSGWQSPPVAESATPAVPGTPAIPPTAPGGGWEIPTAAAPMPQQAGYVIAGIGARIVAWLIDVTLAGFIPSLLTFAVIDYSSIFRDAFEAAQLDPSGRVTGYTYTIPITIDYILLTLVSLGIQFLYFVGFWTSRWRSTPGMIGLKMRVVDAGTGGTLSVLQATRRWIALGWPLGLLALITALQSSAGLISFGLTVFLFFTTVMNDRKQGLHDKFAGSLVIRSVSSGNGATFVGCLVWGVLVILLSFIVLTVFLAAMWPLFEEMVRTMPTNGV